MKLVIYMEKIMDNASQRQQPCALSRRGFLSMVSAGMATIMCGSLGMTACSTREPQLRIGSNVWPGYEFFFLARTLGYYHENSLRLIELPSATTCIHGLFAGTLEGGLLTLDEVLTARANGLDLVVVTVLDTSNGADVLMALPEIKTLEALKGRRIGVERNATGAVMLDAVLKAAGLRPGDVEIVPATYDLHKDYYNNRKVDAIITFEPVKTQLLQAGANVLFSSALVPDRIVDVLAVKRQALQVSPKTVRSMIAGHFRSLDEFRTSSHSMAQLMMPRLQLTPEELVQAYRGLNLPGIAENYRWLGGSSPLLEEVAVDLIRIMEEARLFTGPISSSGLADARFLPEPKR